MNTGQALGSDNNKETNQPLSVPQYQEAKVIPQRNNPIVTLPTLWVQTHLHTHYLLDQMIDNIEKKKKKIQ